MTVPPDPFTEQNDSFLDKSRKILKQIRDVKLELEHLKNSDDHHVNFVDDLENLYDASKRSGFQVESDVIKIVLDKALTDKEDGGLALSKTSASTPSDEAEILFLLTAWLESLNSQEKHDITLPLPAQRRSPVARPMTFTEKVLAHHALAGTSSEGVRAGDVLMISIDWVITSEAGWFAMNKIFKAMGETKIWRNDRFWIAGDHVVDPRIMDDPQVQVIVEASEKAKLDFKLTEYQGMNFTIMHTEFVRQRAQPGMIVVGADSHTCSSGAVGCLAIGLGAADVVVPLATGQTWFKVPESILVNFVGKPAFGISGKDVILHILGELKRNTVAAGKVVEFSGPGAVNLSIDARFAISNMCTEFGAITGVFVPDEVTYDYMNHRKGKRYRSASIFFRPDDDAIYSGEYTIDLSQVQHTIALYPSPDNVVPIAQKAQMKFDGVFIGACTTTEEDLILAALTLEAGLKNGLIPVKGGKRHVVPGSLPIRKSLKRKGLLAIFEAAGFTIGVPGCSYCVGMGADKAGKGENWLSSQNRNFPNRMGPGAFGNITSAVVVAASSFNLTLTDPRPLIHEIESSAFEVYLNHHNRSDMPKPDYVEPTLRQLANDTNVNFAEPDKSIIKSDPSLSLDGYGRIVSKVITLGDFVDTDALAPAEYLMAAKDDEELGRHCMEHIYPEFRSLVKSGQRVVVGGRAFGCGSSREQAVNALKGLGVQAVIARSFSFIYSRNQPSLGLLGIELDNDDFYKLALDNTDIEIDIADRVIWVAEKCFVFHLAEMEYRLTVNKGLQASYEKFGREIWKYIGKKVGKNPSGKSLEDFNTPQILGKNKLEW